MTAPVPSHLSWPAPAAVLPIRDLRPIVDRLSSIATSHAQDVTLLPGLATGEEEVAADPPPALEQIVDEIGGIEAGGLRVLDLLVEERVDVGPYTLLGAHTTYYPLYEGEDVAVVLTLDDAGTPGAVHGIGEDLALTLAAEDLAGWMTQVADALEAALAQLDARVVELHGEDAAGKDTLRAEVLGELLEQHLLADVLGLGAEDDPEREAALAARELPIVAAADAGAGPLPTLPEGATAVADLRGAPLGARVAVIDAELPGDPLDWHVAWRAGGRVLAVVPD
ncbi:hypothetical protein [Brachybacterium squillarum]|uniref:hypothetical protein n=1 Tax=Brachybacterium squillarum TaxID=661979 RepID=UPI002222EE7E|nr:hypothetical protein [Brachybacterium squillarum]MCW1806296.1 hypothetical protein [Brachybacterium squillarum]